MDRDRPPGPRSPHPQIVAVVGGGITGLAAAWELVQGDNPVQVIVLEGSGCLGGKIQAANVGGITVDTGPDAFLARRPEAVTLCGEIGIADELVAPGSRRAYVWSRGRLRALPDGLALGIPTRLGPVIRSGILSPAGLARAAVDLLGVTWPREVPDLAYHDSAHRHRAHRQRAHPDPGDRTEVGDDRAIGDIVADRLGREVVDRLVDPLIGGIHAGPVSAMSAAAVYPPLLEARAKGGSLFRSLRAAVAAPVPTDPVAPVFLAPRRGVRRVVDVLVATLEERGAQLRTSTPVTAIERNADRAGGWRLRAGDGPLEVDGVVVAVPAGPAADLLTDLDRAVGSLLAEIGYATVTVVTFVFPASSPSRPLDGTGFLVPAVEGRLTTGCTWMSTKWPQLACAGNVVVRASVGRFGDQRATAMDDDELIAVVLDELRPILGLRGCPSATLVTRWPDAFPQYRPGHLERADAIEAGVGALGSVAIAGAAFRGVGIPACIASGRRAARRLLGTDAPGAMVAPGPGP